MKTIKFAIGIILVLFIASACNSDSKADTWTKEDTTKWTQSCLKFMESNGVEKEDAVGFCDCMLKKTSEKYTPKEAENLTEDQERKLWESCDYSW